MNNERFALRASVHILFLKNNKVLLLLRKNISSDGMYGLVAGHLEEKETITQALIREAKEEVNIDLKPNDISMKTVCHSYIKNKNRSIIQFYAVCDNWEGEFVNKEPKKCGELKFFSIDSLPDNTVPYVRDAINKVLSGVRYYEYGWASSDT